MDRFNDILLEAIKQDFEAEKGIILIVGRDLRPRRELSGPSQDRAISRSPDGDKNIKSNIHFFEGFHITSIFSSNLGSWVENFLKIELVLDSPLMGNPNRSKVFNLHCSSLYYWINHACVHFVMLYGI